MILYINTIDKKVKVSLWSSDDFKIINFCEIENGELSEKLLLKIDELLSNSNVKLEDLKLIMVNPGPGSYTSLRISITTANLLALSLNIPVVVNTDEDSKQVQKLYHGKSNHFISPVLPVYPKPPCITKSKTRL